MRTVFSISTPSLCSRLPEHENMEPTAEDYPTECIHCGRATRLVLIGWKLHEDDREPTSTVGVGSGACVHCMVRFSVSQDAWVPINDVTTNRTDLSLLQRGERWDVQLLKDHEVRAWGTTIKADWLMQVRKFRRKKPRKW